MTVSYTAEVATCKGFGCFLKLLFRWRGSIYKLVWCDLCLFLAVYFGLSSLYRFGLTPEQQITFERICRYCEKYGNLIPISFVLGFYVSIVVDRWWEQYKAIPWPDSVAIFISANIHGQDEKGRLLRRNIMRYCCLALTLVFTRISPRVKKRFPSYAHFVEAGLLLENEKDIIEEMDRNVPGYSKHWLPIVWAGNLVTRARKEGKIRDDFAVKTILDELNKFRSGCGLLTTYDWISVPLVYTQVVTLAVYSYFLACIMGRQWLRTGAPGVEGQNPPPTDDFSKSEHERKGGPEENLDLFFPFFTTLQFFFYMGWLKVAESLVNPFGDDDDDFELNWMVDRDLQVSYLIVDEMHNHHPELLRDQYWDAVFPVELPHTVASEVYKEEVPHPSTSNIEVTRKEGEIVSPPSVLHMSESGLIMNKPKFSLASVDEEAPAFRNRLVLWNEKNKIPSVQTVPARLDGGNCFYDDDEEIFSLSRVLRNIRRPHTSVEPERRGSFSSKHSGSRRAQSIRSNTSQSTLHSQAGPSRSNSVTSLIKRVFGNKKELSSDKLTPVEAAAAQWKGSTTTMQRNVVEDVIPELDENQATIMSMRAAAEAKKPRVDEIFGTSGAERESSFTEGEKGSRFTTEKVVFTVGGDHERPSPHEAESPKKEEAAGSAPIAGGEEGSDGDSSEIHLLNEQ